MTKMSKLPKRLRKVGHQMITHLSLEQLMDSAADRIEELEKRDREIKKIINLAIDGCDGISNMNPISKDDLNAIKKTLLQYKDVK
jgi:hypothetical protein